jgi:hypothetical protein
MNRFDARVFLQPQRPVNPEPRLRGDRVERIVRLTLLWFENIEHEMCATQLRRFDSDGLDSVASPALVSLL